MEPKSKQINKSSDGQRRAFWCCTTCMYWRMPYFDPHYCNIPQMYPPSPKVSDQIKLTALLWREGESTTMKPPVYARITTSTALLLTSSDVSYLQSSPLAGRRHGYKVAIPHTSAAHLHSSCRAKQDQTEHSLNEPPFFPYRNTR